MRQICHVIFISLLELKPGLWSALWFDPVLQVVDVTSEGFAQTAFKILFKQGKTAGNTNSLKCSLIIVFTLSAVGSRSSVVTNATLFENT